MRRVIMAGGVAAISLAGMSALLALILQHIARLSAEDLGPTDVAESDTLYLELDGDDMAYRVQGRGESAVIFLHGFASSLATWHSIQALLSQHGRTVALDLWGFGASARPPGLAPERWAEQVYGVMEALTVRDAVIVGHSLGGRIALQCAARYPERVRGLVLIGSDGNQHPRGYPGMWAIAHSPLLRYLLHRLGRDPGLLMHFMRESYSPDYPLGPEHVAQYSRPFRVRGTESVYRNLADRYPGDDLNRWLEQVHCPVLLIWGNRDRVTPLRAALNLQKRLPDTELVVLPRTAHVPHEEHPQVVATHIQHFATRCGCGG